MKAWSILPHRFEDKRSESIIEGLRAIGYQVLDHHNERGRGEPPGRPESPLDLLVTWTRYYSGIHQACTKFELMGGRVLVCEEAFIRHPVPGCDQHFCISIHDHNAAGLNCPDHGPSRWHSWNMVEKPAWPTLGEKRRKIYVRQQRGIGSPNVRCPSPDWHRNLAGQLRPLLPGYEVIPLEHPKNLKRRGEPVPRPEQQFGDAAIVVTWNSHSGGEALLEGVPVINACRYYFLAGACRHAEVPETIAVTIMDELKRFRVDEDYWATWHNRRHSTFERYAWCQWSHSELRSGVGLQWLAGK